MSVRETTTWSLIRGGFPESVAEPDIAADGFCSYILTYLERDDRTLNRILGQPASECPYVLLPTGYPASRVPCGGSPPLTPSTA